MSLPLAERSGSVNDHTCQDKADDVPDLPSRNERGQGPAAHWHYCSDERCRENHNTCFIRPTDVTSICDTETASNRTGAGRALGQIYSTLGWRLERSLGLLAHRMGYGPRAAAEQVWLSLCDHERMNDACNRLLRYLRSEEHSVRLTTLNCIISRTTTFPCCASRLKESGAVELLEKCWNESRSSWTLSESQNLIALTSERAIASLFVNEDNDCFASCVFDVDLNFVPTITDGIHGLYWPTDDHFMNWVQLGREIINFVRPLKIAFELATGAPESKSLLQNKVHNNDQRKFKEHYPWLATIYIRTWRKLLDSPNITQLAWPKLLGTDIKQRSPYHDIAPFTREDAYLFLDVSLHVRRTIICDDNPILRAYITDTVCGPHCSRPIV